MALEVFALVTRLLQMQQTIPSISLASILSTSIAMSANQPPPKKQKKITIAVSKEVIENELLKRKLNVSIAKITSHERELYTWKEKCNILSLRISPRCPSLHLLVKPLLLQVCLPLHEQPLLPLHHASSGISVEIQSAGELASSETETESKV